MPFAQGEILVLPFPYSDKLAEKKRPAVVISKPALERTHGLVWVAMVTTDRGARRAADVPISDLHRAGLPSASLVRPVKLATIEPSRVVRSAGALTRADLANVLDALRKLI